MYRTIWGSKSVKMWPILLDRYIHKIYLKIHPFLLILPTTDFIPKKHVLMLSQHAIFLLSKQSTMPAVSCDSPYSVLETQ